MFPERYDVAIVGSSPLLMLAALRLRRAGQSVLLIEASGFLGGAWKVDRCQLGARQLWHECACHLLEWYSGGYGLLEELSSYSFAPLNPQPVRVWNDGRVENYTSKASIARDYILSLRVIAILMVKLGLACLRVRAYRFGDTWRALVESFRRISFASRYRLPGLVSFDAVRGPGGGFAHFAAHLQEELRRSGVDVVHRRASSMARDGADYRVVCEDGSRFFAGRVLVGESTEIACGSDARSTGSAKAYHHVLISLPASQVAIRNAYVHFADNDTFHRMTFVEDISLSESQRLTFFLLQLRKPYERIGNLTNELNEVFSLYRIAPDAKDLKVWKVIDDMHVSSSAESPWRDYQGGHAVLVRTVGDLTRNVIVMNSRPPFSGAMS